MINLCKTTSLGNKVKTGNDGVISARTGTKVFLSDSILKKNSAQACGAISADTNSVLNINSSQIQQNNAKLMAGAFCIHNNSLFIFKNLSIEQNTGYLSGSTVLLNSTGYMENCTLAQNQGIYAGAIIILKSELRLSSTSLLHNMAHDSADIDSQTDLSKYINKLYTYRCFFKHDNQTLKSNASNFKAIALKKNFLHETIYHPGSNIAIEETQFASGKLLYLVFLQ